MINCSFSTVRERDMDLLFLESFVSDATFTRLVLNETKKPDYIDQNVTVLSAELSRTEAHLGESDITIIIEVNGQRVALLIEDKVDAIAMPNQYERYRKRGKKGVEKGEWQAFEIFIFCPEKYYGVGLDEKDYNHSMLEAHKYDHFISYETFKNHFDGKDDVISNIRSQQLAQAITKAKKTAETNVDSNANAYFNQYVNYQESYYPALDMRTSRASSGWWPHYGTLLGDTFIYHKTQEGYVDLTFYNAATQIEVLQNIALWLRSHGMPGVTAKKTGKAGALRVVVPKLNVKEPFELTNKQDLKKCFDVIQELTDFANMAAAAYSICAIKSEKQK